MKSLKILLALAVILATGVGAYIAYDPYKTNEEEVFDLHLKALAGGEGEGGEQGEGGEGGGQGEGGSQGESGEGGGQGEGGSQGESGEGGGQGEGGQSEGGDIPPAIITCRGGFEGPCFLPYEVPHLFFPPTVMRCDWTGRPKDECWLT